MSMTSTGVADFRTLTIGPVQIGKHRVRLRPAVIGDARRWRELRLRDQDLIEPFWIASGQDWDTRHTENAWVREVLVARHTGRTRQALPMVIEVDGQFCGQCNLTAIDLLAREAELGIWVEAEVAGHSVSALAAGLIVDFGFGVMGLRRIIAPLATTNRRAKSAARAAGFRCEARLPAFVSTGSGVWVDHELWVLTPDQLPEDGMIGATLRRVDANATPVTITELVHSGKRSDALVLPSTPSELRAVIRYHLGALRRMHRRFRPIRVPTAAGRSGGCVAGLRLRRIRLRDALVSSSVCRGATSVITPLRRGSWFAAAGPSIAFHITLDRRVIGRAELVGFNSHHHVAEAVVRVDRERADVDIAGAATRMLLTLGRTSLDLHRITGATDPDDDFAAAVAVASGLHHQGRIADTAMRDGIVGDVDVWATERIITP